jgi:hypothetical protein
LGAPAELRAVFAKVKRSMTLIAGQRNELLDSSKYGKRKRLSPIDELWPLMARSRSMSFAARNGTYLDEI